MNQQLNFIFKRRSVRRYLERPVSNEMVKDILEAAMAAPSAVAKDPWHFIVIRDKKTLAKVVEALPNGKMLGEAAVGIVVCGDLDAAHDNALSYMIQDCSAAIENLLLAVANLDLGACWLGVHPRQDRIDHIKTVFQLPENVLPLAAVAIGYPEEEKEARTRYNEAKVHHEKW